MDTPTFWTLRSGGCGGCRGVLGLANHQPWVTATWPTKSRTTTNKTCTLTTFVMYGCTLKLLGPDSSDPPNPSHHYHHHSPLCPPISCETQNVKVFTCYLPVEMLFLGGHPVWSPTCTDSCPVFQGDTWMPCCVSVCVSVSVASVVVLPSVLE